MVATKENLIDLLRHEKPEMKRRFGVKRLAFFGSFADGEVDRQSDVDLLIELERPIGFLFLELYRYLEKKLGRKIDILTFAGLKSIRVKSTATHIRRSCVYV